MDPELDAMTPDEVLLRRCNELARDFRERHPAKSLAMDFVEGLYKASRSGAGISRADRDRERAGAELYVRFGNLSDMFSTVSSDLEQYVFDRLLRIMRSAYELGVHAAPDGVIAREVRRDRAEANFIMLVQTVGMYLEARQDLKLAASEKFAGKIRPDILDALALPPKARSPSLSAIVRALRAIRKRSFVL